jgi:putative PIN family toxin of toxin-antitoxin system
MSEVLTRLARRFQYPLKDAETFVRLITARATIVQISGELKICRDPDDDEILEAAILGKSQYLVTRDDDLKRDLELMKVIRRHRVRVVSVRQFLHRLSRSKKS